MGEMHKCVQTFPSAAALQHVPDLSAELLQLRKVGITRAHTINLAAQGGHSQHVCAFSLKRRRGGGAS